MDAATKELLKFQKEDGEALDAVWKTFQTVESCDSARLERVSKWANNFWTSFNNRHEELVQVSGVSESLYMTKGYYEKIKFVYDNICEKLERDRVALEPTLSNLNKVIQKRSFKIKLIRQLIDSLDSVEGEPDAIEATFLLPRLQGHVDKLRELQAQIPSSLEEYSAYTAETTSVVEKALEVMARLDATYHHEDEVGASGGSRPLASSTVHCSGHSADQSSSEGRGASNSSSTAVGMESLSDFLKFFSSFKNPSPSSIRLPRI